MKLVAILIALFLGIPALAEKKPDPTYVDAVLKSFRTVGDGQKCNDGNCKDTERGEYTIVIDTTAITLTPVLAGGKKAGAMFSLGYSQMFAKDNCLYGQLPGTHIQVRVDGQIYHVKLGKRESTYKMVAANPTSN